MEPYTTHLKAGYHPFRSFLTLENGFNLMGSREEVISLNPYGRGCDFGCLYCPHSCDKQGPAVAADEGDLLKTLKKGLLGSLGSKVGRAFKRKAWLYIGSASECLGPAEEKNWLTLQVLELLKEYNYRYTIVTKNDLIATPPYLRQLNPPRSEVQISFSTPMDYCSRIMEKGVPVTSQRLKVARLLTNNGSRVVGRIEPIFPDRPDYFYSLGRRNPEIPQFIYWNNTLVRMLWAHGIKEILIGMVRPDRKTFPEVQRAFGFDLAPYCMERYRGNPVLSMAERDYYYTLIKKIAEPLKVFTAIVDPEKES